MSAIEALRLAQERGIRFGIAGTDLILDAEREPAPQLLEAIRDYKEGIIALLTGPEGAWTAQDWQRFFYERVALAEFDDGAPHAEAAGRAYGDCVTEWLVRNPAPSASDRCAWCGEPDGSGRTVVPFWTGSTGHTWLHHQCWQAWSKRREAEAVDALAQMGVTAPKCADTDSTLGRFSTR